MYTNFKIIRLQVLKYNGKREVYFVLLTIYMLILALSKEKLEKGNSEMAEILKNSNMKINKKNFNSVLTKLLLSCCYAML